MQREAGILFYQHGAEEGQWLVVCAETRNRPARHPRVDMPIIWADTSTQNRAVRVIQGKWREERDRLILARPQPSQFRRKRTISSESARIGSARLLQFLFRRQRERPGLSLRAIWRPVLHYACKGGSNLCGPEAFRNQAALAARAVAWYAQYARWYAALRRRSTVVLDAFCGMGGASEGASRLPGVRVVGVDI